MDGVKMPNCKECNRETPTYIVDPPGGGWIFCNKECLNLYNIPTPCLDCGGVIPKSELEEGFCCFCYDHWTGHGLECMCNTCVDDWEDDRECDICGGGPDC